MCALAFLKVELEIVYCTVRKQIKVENFICANFLSNSLTPSIDEKVQRLPQQALQQQNTKEYPLLAAWELPLFYGACGLGAKIGTPIGKKLNAVLYGPLGKVLGPVVGKAVLKKMLIKICPKMALVTWGILSTLIPVPGA